MFKDVIKFTNPFDEEVVFEGLFHVNELELADLLKVHGDITNYSNPEAIASANPHYLLDLVGSMVDISYGIREGNKFRKSPEILQDFIDSGAYSAYIMHLIGDPDAFAKFITGILPNTEAFAEAKAKVAERIQEIKSE